MAKVEEIVEAPEVPPPKINNASLSELKATSDDAIAPYMKSLEFVQSHTLSDVRLALGYTAVLAVAIAAYYEYRVGFQAAKGWSTLSVGVYFLLNAALYCWTTYIERDVVYIGSKGDLRFEISTSVKKYDPTYNVVFRAYRPSEYTKATNTKVANITARKSFAAWFDTEGTFVTKPFDNWLRENIINAEKQLVSGKGKKKN